MINRRYYLFLKGSTNMLISFNASIWLCPQPIDFRKGLDSLVVLVADQLQLNPTSGQLFLFRDKTAKKIKMLWWERNGFWLLYKRLEQGRLQFPPPEANAMELTRDQLGWLLSGLDCLGHTLLPEVKASNFY
jgi:transposase